MVAAAESLPAGAAAVERLEAVLTTFARRALQNRRLAWALLAEPVDPLVDAERLAYRERYASLVAAELPAAVAAGEIPDAGRRASPPPRWSEAAARPWSARCPPMSRRPRTSSDRSGRSSAGRSGRRHERRASASSATAR